MNLSELNRELDALRAQLARQVDDLRQIENGGLPGEQRERAERMRAEISALQRRLDEAQALIDAVRNA